MDKFHSGDKPQKASSKNIFNTMAFLKTMFKTGCIFLCTAFCITACGQQNTQTTPPAKPTPAADERIGLTIYGYNYTNRYINSFSVNSNGGGNIFVSDPINGGGKFACCFSYSAGSVPTVVVNWQNGGCYFKNTYNYGRTGTEIHHYFKEVRVKVDPNIPADPHYFEVHIYPDGHVEAAITATLSESRLALTVDREDRSDYPRCPNDQKPKD